MLPEKFFASRVVPIYFNPDPEIVLNVIKACFNAGIKVMEIVDRDNSTAQVLRAIHPFCRENQILLGVGSVLSAARAQEFCSIGVDFMVSPGTDDEVLTTAVENKVQYIPGVFTPTEIVTAYKKLSLAGYQKIVLKVFPASQLSPEWLSAVRAPLQQIKNNLFFMATGGITTANAAGWLNAGCCSVGMGGELLSRDLISRKDYEALGKGIRGAVAGITLGSLS